MPNLSAKELTAIDDQLNLEQVMITKYQQYAQACTDAQLKQKCEQIATMHQNHYTKLMSLLS